MRRTTIHLLVFWLLAFSGVAEASRVGTLGGPVMAPAPARARSRGSLTRMVRSIVRKNVPHAWRPFAKRLATKIGRAPSVPLAPPRTFVFSSRAKFQVVDGDTVVRDPSLPGEAMLFGHYQYSIDRTVRDYRDAEAFGGPAVFGVTTVDHRMKIKFGPSESQAIVVEKLSGLMEMDTVQDLLRRGEIVLAPAARERLREDLHDIARHSPWWDEARLQLTGESEHPLRWRMQRILGWGPQHWTTLNLPAVDRTFDRWVQTDSSPR
jgi:hypothetical protein